MNHVTILGQLTLAMGETEPVDRSLWTDEDIMDVADKIERYLKFDGSNGDTFSPHKRIIQLGGREYQYVDYHVVNESAGIPIGFANEIVVVYRNEDRTTNSFLGINWRTDLNSKRRIVLQATDMELTHILTSVSIHDVLQDTVRY